MSGPLSEAASAVALVREGLDRLRSVDLTPADEMAARQLVRDIEALGTRVDALRVDVMEAVDRPEIYRPAGHGSAKVFVRHVADLSNAEAAKRARQMRAMRRLRSVRKLWRDGRLGSCQVDRLARTFANPRVRDQMVVSQKRLRAWAVREDWVEFDARMTDWERYVDEDGARDRDQARHEQRDAKLTQSFDLSWSVEARCASLQGAQLHEIFRHFLEAETLADWEKARADKGDDATRDDLARTDQQRRFDALFEIFQRAASGRPGGEGPRLVTDVVIDQRTFERELARLAGRRPARPQDEVDQDFERFRCSTLDGVAVDPTAAVARALLGHVRRVVVDARSVVVDMGRAQRLFTGPAAIEAKLATTHCYWPGCRVGVTSCQVDHLEPHCRGGPTDQANAGPLCQRHNRLKHSGGFHAWRDPAGSWVVTRADGTPLPDG